MPRVVPFDGEMGYQNFSVDDIAEMRARRILLNEKLKQGEGVNNMMLESLVQSQMSSRQHPNLKIVQSPIPRLYQDFRDTPNKFLKFARLHSVILLKLSGVVEHILQLDLKLLDDAKLNITFKGQRKRRYTNAEPPIIEVKGICSLQSKAPIKKV